MDFRCTVGVRTDAQGAAARKWGPGHSQVHTASFLIREEMISLLPEAHVGPCRARLSSLDKHWTLCPSQSESPPAGTPGTAPPPAATHCPQEFQYMPIFWWGTVGAGGPKLLGSLAGRGPSLWCTRPSGGR